MCHLVCLGFFSRKLKWKQTSKNLFLEFIVAQKKVLGRISICSVFRKTCKYGWGIMECSMYAWSSLQAIESLITLHNWELGNKTWIFIHNLLIFFSGVTDSIAIVNCRNIGVCSRASFLSDLGKYVSVDRNFYCLSQLNTYFCSNCFYPTPVFMSFPASHPVSLLWVFSY